MVNQSIASLILLFALLFISSAPARADDGYLIQLLADLEQIKNEHNIPAVGLTLINEGKPLYADAFGITDVNTQQLVDSNSLFRLGSISKTFAGLAALKAQELGLFQLTDNVSRYLGKQFINNPWQQTHPVKIVHLLEHTAGFYDISPAEFNHDEPTPIALQDAFELSPKSRAVYRQPGEHSSYSNLGAPIVAYIIERTSGMSYEAFVSRYILRPLDMQHSSFLKDDYASKHLVVGHRRSGESTIPYWHLAYRPFGALNSSVSEMTRFLQLLINQGEYQGKQLFSRTQIERLQRPESTLGAQQGLTFGYGLGVYASLFGDVTLYGHGGTAAGHLAEYRYSPALKLGFAVFININNKRAINLLSDRISEFLTAPYQGTSTPTDKMAIADDLHQYTGYYQYASTRNKSLFPVLNVIDLKHVFIENNHLILKGFIRTQVELYPVGNGLFTEPDEITATAAFIHQDGKPMVLQTNSNNYQRISPWAYWSKRLATGFIVVVVLLGLIYALVWLPYKMLGKLPGAQNTWSRLLPLICLPVLISPLFFKAHTDNDSIARWLLNQTGYLFIILTLICIALSIKALPWKISRLAKINIALSSLANVIIGSYLLVWRMI